MSKLVMRSIVTSVFVVVLIATELIAVPAASADTCTTVNASGKSVACTTPADIALGVYVPYVTSPTPDYSPIESYISETGKTPAVIQRFSTWGSLSSPDPFPQAFVNYILGKGATPMITWQPGQGIAPDTTTSVLTTITSGTWDRYITKWADAAKAVQSPVYVRLMHEMNLANSKYAWAYGVNGNTPQGYVQAFQHVVTIFKQEQANNVQFVWSPVAPGTKSLSLQRFYPGDPYTSWAALDGYNRFSGTAEQMFTSIFAHGYSQIVGFSKRPVMIAETASVETTGDPTVKAGWITSCFLTQLPAKFPRVKAVLYFDGPGPAQTYPVDSSPQSLSAYKSVVSNSLFSAAAPQFSFTF